MRKLYLISGSLSILAILIITAMLVSADNPTTPFEYTKGDDDDTTIVSSVQVSEDYNGDFSELSLITEEEARSFASAYADNGKALGAELESEKGNVVWEVEVKYNGDEFDIIVDAGNGEVLGAFFETESLWESWFDD
ncbi:MAG: PepSY domain-containing protein [Candidatus Kariarchaeaceae archaeon]|jgi:uncharacterized membrane protein YkoI